MADVRKPVRAVIAYEILGVAVCPAIFKTVDGPLWFDNNFGFMFNHCSYTSVRNTDGFAHGNKNK